MALTDDEKKEIKQQVLDEIKTESNDITELDTVDSLDNVKSLPALQGETLVLAPISLLGKPATDAAATANAAAANANSAKDNADASAKAADNATTAAKEAAQAATDAANAASEAASGISSYDDRINTAMGGAIARFDGFVANGEITEQGSMATTNVYYDTGQKLFLLKSDSGFETAGELYMNSDKTAILKDKGYLLDGTLYVWSKDDSTLVAASGSGSGSGFYNVTDEQPLASGSYYDKDTAIAALANAKIDDDNKPGMILTFEQSAGIWVDYRFVASSIDNFLLPASWEEYGGGKIKSISLNGTNIEPDTNGNVAIAIDQISVDESLDEKSTNPVQNAVVTSKINEISDAAVGGVEVIADDEKNTLNILNKKGTVIASAEFTGGGGSGTSTASRIILTAALDKTQIKEGGTAELTYSYNHVNSDNEADGIKGEITITIQRGTTKTYEQTIKDVSAGTYTLDVSEYLLAGTMDIYVKAVATTADGTQQTKQAYASLQVITLTLTSSYNLGTNIAQGGYKNTDTIEIPFTITGSGTKDVSMYLDGSTTPTVQTINKSGTVNGSFTIQGSSLSAGLHTVQLVAERNGLLSDSIFIDILKAGNDTAFVGVKYTDPTGSIIIGDSVAPKIQAAQYETMSFQYVAYDPDTTPATVEVWLNSKLSQTINAPRTMQTYTNRPTEQGTQTLELKIGSVSRTVSVNVTESSINISEATYGLLAKFNAAGRSNSESDPAIWESGDIKTTFSGFDWSSNGWTGDALKLTNGAKAVIGYQPFKSDIKSTGLTIEITMRVSNIMTRTAPVLSCIDGGKGILFTAEEASFKTGQSVSYNNEDDEQVTREIKLGTNFVADEWIKAALVIRTAADNRLMELYINGNRTGADIYDTSFNFQQDTPQDITIDSAGADVEIRSIRIYNRAVSDDEELENRIVDAETSEQMMSLYDDNNILGDTGGVDIDKIRSKGKGVLRIVRANKLDDVYAENNKKTDFKADIYFYSPYGSDYDFVLKDCNIRIQGTSSTKYPAKNLRIYMAKGGESLSLTIGGVDNPNGSNKYKMRPGAVAMNLFCCKADYSDSSMSLNTGGAKLFNDIFKELGLLTPPQRYQYEQGGNQTSAINIRTAIDGIPIDIFCAETEDGESEYYGQYNFNNEKSKSQTLFGQEGVDGFTADCPMTLETLNNGEKTCLFQSDSDDDLAANFDAGLETNYPDDVKWAGLTDAQKTALTRLFGWIRACVPTGAKSSDLSTFVSSKFVSEIDNYFDKDFILTYYLWTDYFLSVDQRAKNMLLRTWDGLKWYITYYDGDTQLGKRNDCFLAYTYTTDRDTYDAEASKYAFEGRESWLWNLVLANLQDDLRDCAAKLRAVMTNERVLNMFNVEQAGHWSDRAFNKSGELKYIKPAVQEMYGKVWPFIYALQGSNTSHREYLIKNRFALLDAKYGTSNFTSDNIDMYLSRAASEEADVIKITANEVYAFGYGTNNSPNIANSGIIQGGEIAELSIGGAYTVNDPLRVYGASRIKVLNMTGAADHLKNGLDLGKCSVLQEINLQSSGSGSTGWWLVLNACHSLIKLNVRNQQQAKTGSSTSKEIDLSNNTKLEYLDARGTQVESVNFAQGAPVATAYLPSTIKTLRLEYLSQLSANGLTLESWANVETLIFAGCPLLDWQTILSKCTNIKRLRVTGVDMEGDGTLLANLLKKGGMDADGNYTDTCALIGTYRLTKFIDDDTFAAYVEHYPELNIKLPEYTLIEFDDTVSDPKNITNKENGTTGDTYEASGHVLRIREKLVPVKGRLNVSTGVWEGERLSNTNYCQLADGSDFDNKDELGEGFDVMMRIPDLWYKGINDFKNQKKYICWSSLPSEPLSTASRINRKYLRDIIISPNVAVITTNVVIGTSTLASDGILTATADYNAYGIDVEGMKQVRYPGINHAQIGGVFLNADGVVIDKYNMVLTNSMFDFAEGDYIFIDVPQGAKTFVFGSKNTNADLEAIAVDSAKIEAIEPDWVHHEACLGGVYHASIDSLLQLRSISGATVRVGTGTSTTSKEWVYDSDGNPTNTPLGTLNYTYKDFINLAARRGAGYQLFDYEMSKLMAILYFSLTGNRDAQLLCGYGRSAGGATGTQDLIGNTDTKRASASNGNKCLGFENFFGCTWEIMDNVGVNISTYKEWKKDNHGSSNTAYPVDAKWHIYDPIAKTERVVQGIAASGKCIGRVKHGRFCDVIASKCTDDTSKFAANYADGQQYSGSRGRIVGRANSGASTNGGLVYANAYSTSVGSNTYGGARLAFRGKISIKGE